ncbi:MAG: large conductance mechanosensitive channel protein MscL [Coriobacteriaceae bacterium]|jgi:large conductance mechanosensitive channel|nr:large conductance mechanosensitive channel protein MscL [Coriobacteriaceae bacterium]
MKKFFKEFKEFINRGNVMDLAVAVVIGAAFTAIVNSLVSDFITPILSALTGGANFANMKWVIPLGAGESAITYGNILNTILQFITIAFVVFCIVKAFNKMKELARKNETEQLELEAHCPYCKEVVKIGATRCPHCTAAFPEPAQAAKAADADGKGHATNKEETRAIDPKKLKLGIQNTLKRR